MDPGEGRMDFEFASLSRELISEIEARCNAEVVAARPIRTQVLPRDEAFQIPDLIRTKINLLPAGISEVRTVEIVGLDLQADGGTHVANTSEVEVMRVVDYKSKGASNKRIYIRLA
jgi:misacylated tRNA(Ala) deacylase